MHQPPSPVENCWCPLLKALGKPLLKALLKEGIASKECIELFQSLQRHGFSDCILKQRPVGFVAAPPRTIAWRQVHRNCHEFSMVYAAYGVYAAGLKCQRDEGLIGTLIETHWNA